MAACHSISCSFANTTQHHFNENEDLAAMAERATRQRTNLIAYFAYNTQNADGQNVVYADFPVNHVWKIPEKVWFAQQRREKAVGRMYFVHFTASERFFLHLLLIVILGATSFEHLRTIDNTEHSTFQVAYGTLGLLQDDIEWDTCMREACIDQDAKRLKNLFVTLLLFCSPLNPKVYGKDIETICCMIRGIDASRMEALPRMPTMTPYYSSRPN